MKRIPFIHRNSSWERLPLVGTYHGSPQLLAGSHWTVPPMPGAWVGREPPGRPGLMAPWASKPRGLVAQGDGANHGCRLAVASPLPLASGLPRLKEGQRRPTAVWGSVSVGSSGLLSIRRRARRPLPITSPHRLGAESDVLMCARGTMMKDWQSVSRMPAVTDASPHIPFRGSGGSVSAVPASKDPQDTPTPRILLQDRDSDRSREEQELQSNFSA